MISTSDLTRVTGSTVVDSLGEKIGTAREVYVDDATGEPEWVTVKTGLFGTSESFVPLAGARLAEDALLIPFEKSTVKGAPRPSGSGHLTPEEEDDLYRFYGLSGISGAPRPEGTAAGRDPGAAATTRSGTETGTRSAVGTDVSGPSTDDAMTRSEERLVVSTERHVTGRARLRKFVTTEMVTVEVPVRREEVRLVEEPLSGTGVGAGQGVDAGEPYDGPPVDLGDGETVVVLHEERPVVTMETVPVEQVRLVTDTVTETRAVSGEVRTEHIEMDTDVDVDGGTRGA